MRALVTGASGAVGAHIAKALLDNGHEVISIRHDEAPFDTASLLGIREKIIWTRGTITNEQFVKRLIADHAPDTIFHFAALPLVQVATRTTTPIFQANILGTVHILEAIKENAWAGKDIRLIAASTDKAYGDAGAKPYTEDMPLNGLAIYDASKACADLVVRTYAKAGLIPAAVVVRPCNIVAPGDLNLGRVLPRAILPCLRGESPTLYRTTYQREFIAVEDAVQAFLMLDDRLRLAPAEVHTEAFNVGSGEQRSLDQAIDTVLSYFPGIKPLWTTPPAISRVEIPFQLLDASKIQTLLGWRAKLNFEATVRRLILWWQERWEALPRALREKRITGWHG